MGEAKRRRESVPAKLPPVMVTVTKRDPFTARVISFPSSRPGRTHLFEITGAGLVYEVVQSRGRRVHAKHIIDQVQAFARELDVKEAALPQAAVGVPDGLSSRSAPLEPEQLQALFSKIKEDAAKLEAKEDESLNSVLQSSQGPPDDFALREGE